MAIRFGLLGPVEARIDGQLVDLGHARQRCVLVALLVDAGRVVPIDVVLERVWAGRLPHRARPALSGYLSRLRRTLPDVPLSREDGGYRLAVDPMTVDLHRFRQLVNESGDDREARLTEALGLWRGDAFGTLETPWLNGIRATLEAERHAAELDRNDLVLERGQHAALLAELSARAVAHPFDERLAGQVLLALYRCGRAAEALRHYDTVRRGLAEELGADPSPALQRLHQRILTADPSLSVAASPPVPRQLPTPPGSFAGRLHELERLDASIDDTVVVISAVSGTAGVGKTALALRWAHRAAERFPDGQLYVNLRGFDPGDSVMSPEEAVPGFLAALDVAPQRIPARLDTQTAMYRSLLAGKRMLIVLDNARDAEQVRPLLPGTPGCLVLVTSRNQLTSLVAGEGAHPVTLDLLTPDEARELLARRIGGDRVAAAPDAVTEIITRCARLPLALALVAARAAIHPGFPLETFADELRADPMTGVRAVFAWSYETLSPAAASLFRLLGLHPGPDIATPAAASLAGLPLAEVWPPLAELTRVHLLTEHSPGRYTFHDLLRAYASEQAQALDTEADRRQATRRMLDHYLHTAHTASLLVDPHRADPIGHLPARSGVTPEHLVDSDQAMAWFTAERDVLLATMVYAAGSGFGTHCWRLSWTLADYRTQPGHRHALAAAHTTALRAARRSADRLGQALSHHSVGITLKLLGRYDDAHTHLQHALDLHAELGNHHPALGVAHRSLAGAAERQGLYQDALTHAQQALEADRAARDTVGQVRSLNAVGWYHALLGNHQRALAYCEPALARYHEIDDRVGEAATLDSLGYIHHHLGHHHRATDYYQRALDLYRETGHRYLEGEALNRIGDTQHTTGDLDAARSAWQHALAILTEFDHPDIDEVRAKLAGIQRG